MTQRFILDCGCAVLLDHERSDRMTTCPGGGIPADSDLANPQRCTGGIKYCITAEIMSTVVYTARRLVTT